MNQSSNTPPAIPINTGHMDIPGVSPEEIRLVLDRAAKDSLKLDTAQIRLSELIGTDRK